MFDSAIHSFYQTLAGLGYKHPVHPVLVHVTIGLVMGAFLFAAASSLFRRESVLQSARHCVLLALLFLFPTALLGLMDWKHFYAGAWIFPIKAKVVLASILLPLLVMIALFVRGRGLSPGALVLYGLSFLNVIAMGYFGGDLVYGSKAPPLPSELQAGEQLYAKTCKACHPNGGNTLDPTLPVRGSPKLKDFDTFLAWVRDPDAPMPPFPETKISASQSKDLYDYVAREFMK